MEITQILQTFSLLFYIPYCYWRSFTTDTRVYQSFRTESITKSTTVNTRLEATQSVMAPKLTRLTHKIVIQLHLVAESCTICSSRSRRPVQKLLDTPPYTYFHKPNSTTDIML
jgi:hypothetical protein